MKFVLAFIFFVNLVHADRDGGPYLGIGYGVSQYKDGGLYDSIEEKNTKLRTMYGGAYINKHLCVELGYARIDGQKYKVVENNVSRSLNYTMYSISTLAHYAFYDDRWDFYLKFGAGKVKLDKEEGFTFVYGIGTSLRFNEMVSLKLAYEMYDFGYDEEVNGKHDGSSDYKMRIYYPYVAVEFQF